ncbi:hypothetical protein FOWG_14950 [Fusarium oxysporum f. sp. lycopersici MN25]|uniref:Uncharacterized protein n=1 Tax=Fusarium oxysporum Fo47 TaxID=660027 RepID=W9KQT9_FUSOX|nr:hypothetical protein FOZG_04650 [Fusarium oxysporum Fo47]EWZ80943.1 hypothetical protein FOWG_14950 [Fusarium oxysporum f. sp. lycopersici MN25]
MAPQFSVAPVETSGILIKSSLGNGYGSSKEPSRNWRPLAVRPTEKVACSSLVRGQKTDIGILLLLFWKVARLLDEENV